MPQRRRGGRNLAISMMESMRFSPSRSISKIRCYFKGLFLCRSHASIAREHDATSQRTTSIADFPKSYVIAISYSSPPAPFSDAFERSRGSTSPCARRNRVIRLSVFDRYLCAVCTYALTSLVHAAQCGPGKRTPEGCRDLRVVEREPRRALFASKNMEALGRHIALAQKSASFALLGACNVEDEHGVARGAWEHEVVSGASVVLVDEGAVAGDADGVGVREDPIEKRAERNA